MSTPDDWHTLTRRCPRGHVYHPPSDGCCACADEDDFEPLWARKRREARERKVRRR